MKMKEVVARTGLSEKTIRFYEDKGLVTPKKEWRNGRTYHEFSEQNVETLNAIIQLREAQFSLGEILSIQNDPSTLPEVLEAYRQRIRQESSNMAKFSTIADALDSSKIDSLQTLYYTIRVESKRNHAYVPKVNFGRFDPEEDFEIQKTHATKYMDRSIHPSLWIIGILSFLLLLSLSVNVWWFGRTVDEIPATTESTSGWLYYMVEDTLMRCKSDGSSEKQIHKKSTLKDEFEFIVDEKRIYFIEDTKLYSINADGSGKHRYDGTYETSPVSNYSSTWPALTLHNGYLYAFHAQSGTFVDDEQELVRISTQTGEIDVVDIVHGTSYLGIADNELYIYQIDAESIHMKVLSLTDRSETFSADLNLVAAPVWFSDGLAYFSVRDEQGSKLIQISTDNPEGTVVDQCSGWYWGGYDEYYVYSENGAFVTAIGSANKEKVIIRDWLTMNDYGVVSTDIDHAELTAYPEK